MTSKSFQSVAYFSLSRSEVANLLKDLVSTEDQNSCKDAFFVHVTQAQWDSVTAIRDAVAYLGFDPRKIIQEFLKRAKANLKKETDVPVDYTSPGGNKFQLYESNDPATDLLFFITLFLERGNNNTKILMRCDGDVGTLIRRKASAYGIVLEKKQSSSILGTSSLTLARLSQAFPVATASIILKNALPGKLKTKALAGVISLPIIMQHRIFPSLIPTEGDDEVTDGLKSVALVLNMETSILLATPKERRKIELKDVDELSQQAEQYVDAAMSGTLLDDATKIKILKKGGIIDAEGKLTLVAAGCAGSARAFLRLGAKTFNKAVKARNEEIAAASSAPAPGAPN